MNDDGGKRTGCGVGCSVWPRTKREGAQRVADAHQKEISGEGRWRGLHIGHRDMSAERKCLYKHSTEWQRKLAPAKLTRVWREGARRATRVEHRPLAEVVERVDHEGWRLVVLERVLREHALPPVGLGGCAVRSQTGLGLHHLGNIMVPGLR